MGAHSPDPRKNTRGRWRGSLLHSPDNRTQDAPLAPAGRLRGQSGRPNWVAPLHDWTLWLSSPNMQPPRHWPGHLSAGLSSCSQKQGLPFISGQSPQGKGMECHLVDESPPTGWRPQQACLLPFVPLPSLPFHGGKDGYVTLKIIDSDSHHLWGADLEPGPGRLRTQLGTQTPGFKSWLQHVLSWRPGEVS